MDINRKNSTFAMHFFVFFLLVVFIHGCANKKYTSQELFSMIKNDEFPKESGTTEKGVDSLPFNECMKEVGTFEANARRLMPVKTVVNSNEAYIIQVWGADASFLVSCIKLTDKFVVTRTPYE